MSLEEKMDRLADAIEKNTELLAKIVAGPGKGGTAADAGDKPKPTRRKAADKGDDDGDKGDAGGDVDTDDLKATVKKLAGWLKEFAEDEDDPENDARNEALAATLKKLGVPKASEITTEKDRARFEKWLDARIEEGRTTKKAGAKKAAADDGEEDL